MEEHLENILASLYMVFIRMVNLTKIRTNKNFLLVRTEGSRQVNRNIDYYNLDIVIAVGYRVQSQVAVRFRRWATARLHEYIQKGFAMDDVPENVHPHMFRKSRVMSLYRSSMALSLVSEWLEHNNQETTLIYARADTGMKRRMIEKAEAVGGSALPEAEERMWDNNNNIIRQLLGLSYK